MIVIEMLETDAWAYLNIHDPFCAWGIYRSVIVSPPLQPGFLSVWATSSICNSDKNKRLAKVRLEAALEKHRQLYYPNKVSRLHGFYCFLDLDSAEAAYNTWNRPGNHFHPEFLAELSLVEAGPQRDRLDSNWFTYNAQSENSDWLDCYWSGQPCPGKTPIWEIIVSGKVIILGTELRERAYQVVKHYSPESLMLLEISRLASYIGYDLGTHCHFLRQVGHEIELNALINMVDAKNPEFLSKLQDLIDSGHPVNWEDMAPHLKNGNFGKVPDFRPYIRRFPLDEFKHLMEVEFGN